MAEPFTRPDRPPERVLHFTTSQLFDAVAEYVSAHGLLPAGPARCLLTVHSATGAATFEYWQLPPASEVPNGL